MIHEPHAKKLSIGIQLIDSQFWEKRDLFVLDPHRFNPMIPVCHLHEQLPFILVGHIFEFDTCLVSFIIRLFVGFIDAIFNARILTDSNQFFFCEVE